MPGETACCSGCPGTRSAMPITTRRDGEGEADPEAPRHVLQLRVPLLPGLDGTRLERHAADRARARSRSDDLRVHRAGVLDRRGHRRRTSSRVRPRGAAPGAHTFRDSRRTGRGTSRYRSGRCAPRTGRSRRELRRGPRACRRPDRAPPRAPAWQAPLDQAAHAPPLYFRGARGGPLHSSLSPLDAKRANLVSLTLMAPERVRLHRARQALGRRLARLCGACAERTRCQGGTQSGRAAGADCRSLEPGAPRLLHSA